MNKYLLALSLLLVPVSSFAVDLYHYSPIEGCSLRKAAAGSWQVVPPTEVGSDNFTIMTSKANAAYSNFKYQGSWYAAKTECFKLSDAAAAGGSSDESVTSVGGPGFRMTKGKLFVEPKFSYYIMNGTNTVGGTVGTTVVDKYKPGIGLAAKIGYYLTDHTDAFLEINMFSGSQASTSPGVTSKIDDSVLSFNLGYQYFLSKKGSFTPYGELALGYNKLSQTLSSTAQATDLKLSGSGIGFILEAGTLYELSSSISLMGALNYTIMSFSELTLSSGGTGTQTNTTGYSHIGINVGARYNF